MSRDLIVHFHNEETLRNLERTAEALGITVAELAEAALEIATLGVNAEGRAKRISEKLAAYGPEDLDRDIREFARSEVTFQDPLQSRLVDTRMVDNQDPYDIGALFARRVERG
ncbi:MAG TPA: hypothetical protein VNW71_01895 [Thermoanaerobaculia bacterium]|nr:hypothetical protein [Thermoanaerobaculia bacterium]